MIDEVAGWRPPGSQDLPRAALLAMLGRFDEAWPLAEARSSHLREVTGNTSRDAYGYLALIATIEGDRERACQYSAEEIEVIARVADPGGDGQGAVSHASSATSAASTRPSALLEEARAVPPPGSGVRVMAAAAEALLLAHRGELEQAEALARTAVATAETRDGQRLVAGAHARGPRHRARARRTDRRGARGARAIASHSGSGSAACPAPNASASRSTRSARPRSDLHSSDIPERWRSRGQLPRSRGLGLAGERTLAQPRAVAEEPRTRPRGRAH